MLANALIGLREGLEASLVVSILLAYLVRTGRRDGLAPVWAGVGAAVALSLGFGALLTFSTTSLSFTQQELIGGVLSIVAVAFVTGMVFWMRRSARTLKGELEGKVASALVAGSATLALVAFLAVGREGLETALFLWAAAQAAGSGADPIIGAALGLAAAVVLARLLYVRSVTLDLGRFFLVTGALLVVVAAGVLSYGVHDLQEAGVLPGLSQPGLRRERAGPAEQLVRHGAQGHRQLQPGHDVARGARLDRLPRPGRLPLLPAGTRPPTCRPPPRLTSGAPDMRRTALFLTALVGLTACGGGADEAAPAVGGPVQVEAGDDSCGLSRTDLTAGRNVFEIRNTGSKVTEVYVYAQGDRIVTEKENIGPGLRYELTTQVPAGDYVVACKPGMTGDGIRTPITVAAAASAAPVDPAATKAVADYRAYVQQQADALVPLVQGFAAAVKAGDVARAKALYAPSRAPWEAIEPVAESFGDLDPKVDLREADLEPGQEWTGWHRLEKALWVTGSTTGLDAVADQLVADVTDLQGRVQNADLSPASIGNGAKELLDEVATGKITGEEEAFSHTDLVDFAANVDGAEKALDVLRPLIEDTDLVTRLDAAFADVDTALTEYARGTTYVSYETVDAAGRRELARVVDALGEPLSELAAAASA